MHEGDGRLRALPSGTDHLVFWVADFRVEALAPRRQVGVLELDLAAAGITSVIWGTGYRFDLSWLAFPILDARGEPVQVCGVTAVPGLYVLGFNLVQRPRSAFLPYVGAEAAHIAPIIAARMTARSS